MVGKWVDRTEAGAGVGWWKKVVGPNHSLFRFCCFSLVYRFSL